MVQRLSKLRRLWLLLHWCLLLWRRLLLLLLLLHVLLLQLWLLLWLLLLHANSGLLNGWPDIFRRTIDLGRSKLARQICLSRGRGYRCWQQSRLSTVAAGQGRVLSVGLTSLLGVTEHAWHRDKRRL